MFSKLALIAVLAMSSGCGILTREPCDDVNTKAFVAAVEATTAEHIAYVQADAALTEAQAKIRLARDAEILDRIEIVRTRGGTAGVGK
jgi:hypothetical protein